MGKRGPKPGKTGQRPRKQANYTGEYSLPPDRMTTDAQDHWIKIVADFPPGYHQPKHQPLLEIFCESFTTWCQARTQLDGEGLTIKNEKTNICKINPLIGVINAEVTKMNQLATKLSLVVPLDRPDSDISFDFPAVTQQTSERIAFDKLKSREAELKGVELSLFKKLREKYGKAEQKRT